MRPAAKWMLVRALLVFSISCPMQLLAQAIAGEAAELRAGALSTVVGSDDQDVSTAEAELEASLAHTAEPRTPGIRFRLGLLYFFDRQVSLQNSLSQTTVTLRDPASGGSSTSVLDNDPELNNRKLDFELDLQGAGLISSVELPPVPRLGRVALILEAASARVNFDVLDTTAQSALSASFAGDGPMVGVGFDVTTGLGGRWSAASGYRYRYLPSLEVGRSRPLAPPFEVLADDVTLSRESHELASRFSYAVRGKGYRPYAGVLLRRIEVEIDDHLRFRDGLEQETDLRTLSRFDRESLLAVVGVQATRSSYAGGLESFFGGGDFGVRFQVGWSWSGQGGAGGMSEQEQAGRTIERSQKRVDKQAKRLKKIYPELLLSLKLIEEEFSLRWRDLPVTQTAGGGDAYAIEDVRGLIRDTERALLELLSDRVLEPVRDYVQWKADEAVKALDEEPPTLARHAGPPPGAIVARFAVARGEGTGEVLAANAGGTCRRFWCDQRLELFRAVFSFLGISAGCPGVDLTFKSSFGGVLEILTYAGTPLDWEIPAGKTLTDVPLALYAVKLYRSMAELNAGNGMPPPCRAANLQGACALDLIEKPCPVLECESSEGSPAPSCQQVVGEHLPPASCLKDGRLTCLKSSE